jgi:peptide/nickel transport system permease protein
VRDRTSLPPGAWLGIGLTGLICVLAIAGPWLVSADPVKQDLVGRLAPPVGFGGTLAHPLGTDGLGRDLLARVVAGARVSLLVGVVATLVAGTFGVALGLAAGFGGGLTDRIVTWAVDVQMAVPFVIVAIALTAVLGNGLGNVILALAVTGWVGYARVVRLQTRALRTAPWVEAARSLGAGPGRVATRHLLPNLVPTIVVLASQQVAGMVLFEAALSYLGLGVGGNVITWGGMVADGQDEMLKAWWVTVVPGAAVALSVLGLNALGDWLSGARRRPVGQ